jgi:hypothetical protein
MAYLDLEIILKEDMYSYAHKNIAYKKTEQLKYPLLTEW